MLRSTRAAVAALLMALFRTVENGFKCLISIHTIRGAMAGCAAPTTLALVQEAAVRQAFDECSQESSRTLETLNVRAFGCRRPGREPPASFLRPACVDANGPFDCSVRQSAPGCKTFNIPDRNTP